MDYYGPDADAAEHEASGATDELDGDLGDGLRRRNVVQAPEPEDLGLVRTVGPRAY